MVPLSWSERVCLVASTSVQQLPLTPEEYFVLSRIDGTPTIGEVIQASGMASGQAEGIVAKLLSLGALGRAKAKNSEPRSHSLVSKNPHQNRARERKLGLLKAHFVSAANHRDKEEADISMSTTSDSRSSRAVQDNSTPGKPLVVTKDDIATVSPEEPQAEPVTETAYVFIEPVPITDSRIDRALQISIEDQRQVLAVCDRLSKLTHFDALCLAPTNDAKQIRRAYYRFSRKFHPDNYYGKDIGKFRNNMESLFMRAREAYEVLMNDQARYEHYEHCTNPGATESIDSDDSQISERQRQKLAERRAMAALRRKQGIGSRTPGPKIDVQGRGSAGNSSEKNRRKAQEHANSGMIEKEAGRMAAAAGMFRLALELVPENESYHQMWQETLAQAQYERANRSFASGLQQIEVGDLEAAKWLFEEAVKANPTPKHLAVAAKYLAEQDLAKAHQLAMSALNGLAIAIKSGSSLSGADQCLIYTSCARVFLLAGQWNSARDQIERAENLCPDNEELHILKNSLHHKPLGQK